MSRKQEALDYHSQGRKGKIEVVATKPCSTARDLANAYSPGVAEPCLEIEKNPELAYEYTAKGNLVAVISNGTAVLGLGNIGALAGKPVMEGKGVLFKRFADIDVFDIEVNELDIDKFCQVVKALEPTFGGVNLEDIKAPECFEIETRLKKEMNIPVFHDDQHGTAIISTAALMNASEIVGKKMEDMKVVFSGAGASAIACANMMVAAGVKLENLWLCDTKGLVYTGRTEGNNKYKDKFAKPSEWRTLADTIKDADVFVGCSSKGALTPEMVLSMAKQPIVFALANPDPEIDYHLAKATRPDIIMATGRSDFPNQVNNVLGFPFIFRGALDVRASEINEPMKLAAAKALAALTREEVPDSVVKAYAGQTFSFGPRVHHSQALRPPRAALGGPGGRQGRHGHWRGQEAHRRHDLLQGAPRGAPGPQQGCDPKRGQPGQGQSQARGLPGRRPPADPAGRVPDGGRGHLPAHSPGRLQTDQRGGCEPRHRTGGYRNPRSQHRALAPGGRGRVL